MKYNKIVLIFYATLFLILPIPAFAYLDIGTGSYILQIIIASFLGAIFAFKSFWTKIITKISSFFKKKANDK